MTIWIWSAVPAVMLESAQHASRRTSLSKWDSKFVIGWITPNSITFCVTWSSYDNKLPIVRSEHCCNLVSLQSSNWIIRGSTLEPRINSTSLLPWSLIYEKDHETSYMISGFSFSTSTLARDGIARAIRFAGTIGFPRQMLARAQEALRVKVVFGMLLSRRSEIRGIAPRLTI